MKKLYTVFTALLALTFVVATVASASTFHWKGGTKTSGKVRMETAANWQEASVPTSTDDVVFGNTGIAGTNQDPDLHINMTFASVDFGNSDAFTGRTMTMGGNTLTVTGNFTIGSGTISAGGGAGSIAVAGNYTVNGGTVAATTLIHLNGSSAQTLTGSSFGAVKINNAAGVSCGAATFANLTLTSGVLTASGTVSITATTGASASSYVAGTVSRSCVAATATAFPVGNTSYTPVTVTSGTTGTFGLSSTSGTPTNAFDASDVLTQTYHVTSPAVTATVVFGYADADVPGTATEAGWVTATYGPGYWVPTGSSTENAGANTNTLTSYAFTASTTDWTLGGSAALPIGLTNISALTSANSGVSISWSTTSETNNLGFYVERRAQGSSSFATVSGLIAGAGSSLEQHDYSFTDASVGTGTYYYRLKQVDANGAASFSGEIKVVVNGALGVSDGKPLTYQLGQNYPNPFNPTTNIAFEMPEQGIVTLKVFNVIGQEVATLVNGVQYNAGDANVTFNAASLSSGVYYYHLNVKGVSNSFESIKKMMLVK